MRFLKRAIKYSSLYGMVESFRAKKRHAHWTARDETMRAFYARFVSPGDLCFDVGAHVGNRVKIFLKLQARVVAVEPQDRCVRILKNVYGDEPRLTVIPKVLGASEGPAELMISEATTLSSLSPEWIEAIRESGRFAGLTWDKKQRVEMTTLDRLIEQHGLPAFVKIDVEGYEYQVLQGLSQPVPTLSLEFAPEFIDATFDCIAYLRQLGDIRLNYSIGESMRLALEEWVAPREIVEVLSGYRGRNRLFGDLYVRFLTEEERRN